MMSHGSNMRLLCWRLTRFAPELTRSKSTNDTAIDLSKVPPRPKRPQTGYMLYLNENRDKFMKECVSTYGKLNMPDVSRLAGVAWHNMDTAVKSKFNERARKLLERYHAERINWESQLDEDTREALYQSERDKREELKTRAEKLERRQKQQLFKKPKRPATPFLRFIKQHRNHDTAFVEQLKALSAKWRDMSDNDKRTYFDEFARENEQYVRDLTAWETKMIRDGHIDLVRAMTQTALAKSENTKRKQTKPDEKSGQ